MPEVSLLWSYGRAGYRVGRSFRGAGCQPVPISNSDHKTAGRSVIPQRLRNAGLQGPKPAQAYLATRHVARALLATLR